MDRATFRRGSELCGEPCLAIGALSIAIVAAIRTRTSGYAESRSTFGGTSSSRLSPLPELD
jgi:hypothetical protein